jgi:hypothetical protein
MENTASREANSADDAVNARFLADVIDINNKDMSVVNIATQTATINGTHYKLPEYVDIDASIERLRADRRLAMATLRWHASRLVYDNGQADERMKAALLVATNNVNAIDDTIAELRKTAHIKHRATIASINQLKAEVASVLRDTVGNKLDKALRVTVLHNKIKDTRDVDIPMVLSTKTRVTILQSLPTTQFDRAQPITSPSPAPHQSGGGHTPLSTPTRHQSVKSKVARRRSHHGANVGRR